MVASESAGFVEIELRSPTAGTFYGDGYGQGQLNQQWTLTAVIVSSVPPTPKAAAYLKLTASLEATAVAAFSAVGPFPDPFFTANSGGGFGPDASPDRANLSAAYPIAGEPGHTLSWHEVGADAGCGGGVSGGTGAPAAISLAPVTDGSVDSVAFLVAYATVPTDTAVVLTGSTSALGALLIDGVPVHTMRTVQGLVLADFAVAATLKAGVATEIRLRLAHPSWAVEWCTALSLTTPGGSQVPGLLVAPRPGP